MGETKNKKFPLLTVSFIPDTNSYSVDIPKGSNVPETAFCISVVIKCLIRDGKCKQEEIMSMLNKYLTDPQYEEVKDE